MGVVLPFFFVSPILFVSAYLYSCRAFHHEPLQQGWSDSIQQMRTVGIHRPERYDAQYWLTHSFRTALIPGICIHPLQGWPPEYEASVWIYNPFTNSRPSLFVGRTASLWTNIRWPSASRHKVFAACLMMTYERPLNMQRGRFGFLLTFFVFSSMTITWHLPAH